MWKCQSQTQRQATLNFCNLKCLPKMPQDTFVASSRISTQYTRTASVRNWALARPASKYEYLLLNLDRVSVFHTHARTYTQLEVVSYFGSLTHELSGAKTCTKKRKGSGRKGNIPYNASAKTHHRWWYLCHFQLSWWSGSTCIDYMLVLSYIWTVYKIRRVHAALQRELEFNVFHDSPIRHSPPAGTI